MPTDATQPTDDEVLLPCPNPWCGSTKIELYGRMLDRMRYCCRGCFLKGPLAPTEAEAAAAWNTRTTPQPHIAADPGEVGLSGDEKLTIQRIQVVADASCLPAHKEAHQRDLHAILALVRRLYTDLSLATLTAPEPRAAGEGALAQLREPFARNLHPTIWADYDRVAANPGVTQPATLDRDRSLAEADRLLGLIDFAALRQPSTDRESVIEECAKVADDCAVLADRVEVINHFGVEAAQNAVKLAEGIATAIRALKASSKGGDHG